MVQINSNAHHELENFNIAMPSRDRWYHKFIKIGLFFFVIVTTVFIINQILVAQRKNKAQELFAQYYQPYQLNYQVRSAEVSEINLQQAYQEYDKKNFSQAIALFDKVMRTDNTLQFYKGISNIESGKLNEAVKVLEESLENKSNTYFSQTHWYLSLAFLKLNQPEKAKLHLLWLLKNLEIDNIYRNNASAVLSELK